MAIYVGISGKMGSGKSTVATWLTTMAFEAGIPRRTCAFADPLKALCCEAFDYPFELNYSASGKAVRLDWASFPYEQEIFPPQISSGQFHKIVPPSSTSESALREVNKVITYEIRRAHSALKLPITVGRLLQIVGQAFRDVVDMDVWVKAFLANPDCDLRKRGLVVVEDVRYRNEMRILRAYGGKLIKIVRPGTATTDSRDSAHKSETELDDYALWDFVVENSGNMEELYKKIREIGGKLIPARP